MPVFESEDELVPNADFKMEVEVVESHVPVGIGFVRHESSEPAEVKPKESAKPSAKKSAKKSVSKGKKAESAAKKAESPAKASKKAEKP